MNNLRGAINTAGAVWVYDPMFNILNTTRVRFSLFSEVAQGVRFSIRQLMEYEER